MPGSFEDPDVVLAAADLCIVPSPSQGSGWLMPTALGSHLTTFACDAPAIRSQLGEHAGELLFAAGDSQRLSEMFSRWCHLPSQFQVAVGQVAGHLWNHNSMIDEFARLV